MHAQTVCNRPLLGWEGPGDEAKFEYPSFFEWVVRTLLGYNVTRPCASPRNSTSFTRLFLLIRGWDLGTKLGRSCFVSCMLGFRKIKALLRRSVKL